MYTIYNLRMSLEMKGTRPLRRPIERLSEALVGCGREALVYGNCVQSWSDVQKNDCQKEFTQFRNCYRKLLQESLKKK